MPHGGNRRSDQEANLPLEMTQIKATTRLGFVISQNLKRRHLTESQRAMVAGKLAKLPQGGDQGGNQHQDWQPANLRVGMTQAAALMDVPVRNVFTSKAIDRDGAPETIAAADAGIASLEALQAVATLPAAEQVEIVAKGEKAILEAAKAAIGGKRYLCGSQPQPAQITISGGVLLAPGRQDGNQYQLWQAAKELGGGGPLGKTSVRGI